MDLSVSRGDYFVSHYEKDLFHGRYQDPEDPTELTWEDVFDRTSFSVSIGLNIDDAVAKTWSMGMANGAFLPSSPQLWNYGTGRRFPRNGSSCYTGRMGDTLEDFRYADGDAERVYVASGGFGLLADAVRPRGCKIKHCSEGAMGSMCLGGPIRRVEGTTGYITGSGRARGAFMIQLGVHHIDAIEFILAKRPRAMGFMDDWPANARSVAPHLTQFIDGFTARFVHLKDWPTWVEAEIALGSTALMEAIDSGVVINRNGRVVPMVTDYNTLGMPQREANRDWDLPLQNCNMSIRLPDEFMYAVERDLPWPFFWESMEWTELDEVPWLKHDLFGGLEQTDGAIAVVNRDNGTANTISCEDGPKYAMLITTWEGLRENMSPNKNQWRDTDYARFYRTIVEPAIGHLRGKITASQIWNLICENAWNHADPGIVFSSTYERYQPIDSSIYGPRLSNPCSEYVNSAGGSCNLASVNLRWCAEIVPVIHDEMPERWKTDGFETLGDWAFLRDTESFRRYLAAIRSTATMTMQYIGAAMEYNIAPVEFIQEMSSKHFRTVGVGLMGLAEALMIFHVRYGSECAEMVAKASMSEIALACWEESFAQAAAGRPTPIAWDKGRMRTIFGLRTDKSEALGIDDHWKRWSILKGRVARGEKAAHTCVTSIAPTGSIAQIAGWQMTRATVRDQKPRKKAVSSGCEPVFAASSGRQDNSGIDTNHHDFWFDGEHAEKPWMVSAMDGVTAEEHVRMQAAVCAFCCMSASKTINLPNNATVEDVAIGYKLAWSLDVPGTSLYRDGSKPMQVLTVLECPSGECAVEAPAGAVT